jgi:hypothetical protein
MRKVYYLILILGITFVWILPTEAKNIKEKYPFYPSLLNTHTGKPVESTDFEDPEVCGECHSEKYEQWKGSMHSNAWHDPVFQALWRMGNKETGGLTEKLCAGCHTAIGTVSEELTEKDEKGNYKISDIAQKGVQCDLCHTVKAATYSEAQGLEPHNGTLLIEPGNVKRGPFKDSESDHHETAYSELHTKAEFCANCHHVFHPVNGFPIERTYDEWKNSVYAQNGLVCQDCHMSTVEDAIKVAKTLKKVKHPGKAADDGPNREHINPHYFVGGNFTIPALLGSPKHAEMAKKRLQSAAKLEIIPPNEIILGRMGTVKVKVVNIGAGHNLPTSLTEVRQMWLDVSITDAAGRKFLHSGWLDKKHNIDSEATIFHASAMDKHDHHTVKPWEVVRFEYNHTIPPKGSATEKYSFLVPSDAKGPLKVKTILRYRSYPQKVADMLLGKDAPVLPIVDMAQAEMSLALEM